MNKQMNVISPGTSKRTHMMYDVHGDGEPVVMIHGLGGTSNVWGPQTQSLQRYFKVIRPDLAGSGRTQLDGAPISIERFVQDVVQLIDQLGLQSAHFVGHSMGTIVCQHFAVSQPKRVRSLALFGPIAEPTEPARLAIRARAEKCRTEGILPVADAVVQAGTSADTKANRPEIAAFIREMIMCQDAEGYAQTCEALAAAQAADPGRIACPALLVTGDKDGTAPPKPAQALASRINGAQFRLLGRCGHWTPLERAAEVSEALTSFYFSSAFA